MSRAGRFFDAAALLGVLVGAFVSRRPVSPVAEEAARPLSGDELVPEPHIQWTHAITICAPPADIWPWLVQI